MRGAVRRVVDDEVPGAVEVEAGPAAVRRVPPGLFSIFELPYRGEEAQNSSRRFVERASRTLS